MEGNNITSAEIDGVIHGNNITPAENDGVMHGESAVESKDFHTTSESMEGIPERGENSTDHTVQNNGQETEEVEFNTEDDAAEDTELKQIPKTSSQSLKREFWYSMPIVTL